MTFFPSPVAYPNSHNVPTPEWFARQPAAARRAADLRAAIFSRFATRYALAYSRRSAAFRS